VTQIFQFFPSSPSARAVAAEGEHLEALYSNLSAYLADLGIDVNLAPCLDVNTQPLNPIIGTRAFGSDVNRVSAIAPVAIAALQQRTACVAKHFPGHGMTALDSHLTMPVVEDSREVLHAVHMEPFRKAIRARVDGIMVSHCLYRDLEQDDLPACMSKQVVRGELRAAMAFDGAVFTDSLDMLAVTNAVPADQAALLAFEAGCDFLLYTEYSERLVAAFDAMVAAVVKGRLKEAELAKAAGRRAKLMSRLQARSARARLVPFDETAYVKCVTQARAGSLRVFGNKRLLPLASRRIALIATSPQVSERIRAHVPDLSLLPPREGGPSGAVIAWIWEPLVLRQSLEDIKTILGQAETSVVVTTYPAIADALGGATIRIISQDSGPHAEASILKVLFEI
jgi:beta-N-acetylhexosaminidase